MSDIEHLRRALVQKLESLHRIGVQAIPRPDFGTSTPASTCAPAAAKPPQAVAVGDTRSLPATTSSSIASASVSADSRNAEVAQPSSSSLFQSAPAFESPAIAADERLPVLRVLAREVADCTKCTELAKKRTQTVFGVGNPNARLVFFGEAPGADEDRQGEPFVGKAGQLLTKIIEACKLQREDVYILNVIKCRPPGNRNPTPEEVGNCRHFFEKQLDIIRPEVICCLGSVAATTLLETTLSVGRMRGKFHAWRGIPVAVTYHPAYLLRTPAAKKNTWADMKMVMKQLGVEL